MECGRGFRHATTFVVTIGITGRVALIRTFGIVTLNAPRALHLHIPPYESAHGFETLDPVRPRKLLLHRRELERLRAKVAERGFALIPLDIHFRHGFAKVTLALARGKKLHDKRQALRRADMEREVDRALGTDRK